MLTVCPVCDERMRFDESMAGQSIYCPSCETEVKLPTETADPNRRVTLDPAPSPAPRNEATEPFPNIQTHPGPPRAGSVQPFGGASITCPFCNSNYPPRINKKISSAGWVVFVIPLLFFFPLLWIGLLITEEERMCAACNMRLG